MHEVKKIGCVIRRTVLRMTTWVIRRTIL